MRVLLNWGETESDLVIDPEYLSNMEHPRTTLASDAGLRSGYGSGIASSSIEGFQMLGHGGGIAGFVSNYAYSTSRDVGFVVLLNATHSAQAMRRISQLAVRYLKADVEVPLKPQATIDESTLRSHEGYYHGANPRNQAAAFLEWLLSGESISVKGDRLSAKPAFGAARDLIPVSDSLFRFDTDPEATRVFTKDAAGMPILAGGSTYEERRTRWPIEVIRWAVLISAALVVTPLAVTPLWIIPSLSRRLVRRSAERVGGSAEREAGRRGYWWLKLFLLLCGVAFVLPVIGLLNVNDLSLGSRNAWTSAIFAGTVLMPAAAILSLLFTIDAWRNAAGRVLRAYALSVSIAGLVISGTCPRGA